jgi:hypothetical protein
VVSSQQLAFALFELSSVFALFRATGNNSTGFRGFNPCPSASSLLAVNLELRPQSFPAKWSGRYQWWNGIYHSPAVTRFLKRQKPAKTPLRLHFNALARLALKFALQNGLAKKSGVPRGRQYQPCNRKNAL